MKDGLPLALERSARFQPWFPLYTLVEWAAVGLFGGSEAVLRLPSLIAMAGAAVLLLDAARRLFDEETAWLAALAFAASQEASFYAVDARPYAVALLLMLAALAALLRWLETGAPRARAAFVLCAAGMVYAHFVLAPAASVFALFAWTRPPGPQGRPTVSSGDLAAAAAAVGLLLVPLAWRAAATLSARDTLLWSAPPPWTGLAPVLLPAPLLAAAVAALATGWRARRAAFRPGTLLPLLVWAVAVPVAYFAAARWSPWKVFIARFILWFVPGRALLFAGLVGALEARSARRLAALVLAAAALWSYGERHHSFEDLRGAAAATRDAVTSPRTPVLVPSAFKASLDPGWLADAETTGSLFAPQAYYPLAGRVVPLPMLPVAWADPYAETVAARVLEPSGRFLLVAPRVGDKPPHQAWVEARLGPAGYALTRRGELAGVEILVFERPPRDGPQKP